MRLEIVEALRLIIIAFLAYIPTSAISGWFTAWTAKKCDDDTPEQMGFLTLDPFMHFSIVGFALLLIGQLFGDYITLFKGFPGFGRFILLNPSEQTSKAKSSLAFFARPIIHFIMSITSFFIIFMLFKLTNLYASAAFIDQFAPTMQAINQVLIFFEEQNSILYVIYFLIGLTDTMCLYLNLPRFFSPTYFLILILNFVILADYIAYPLGILQQFIKIAIISLLQ